jgi:cysteine desulfurase/selenocysteine lyase
MNLTYLKQQFPSQENGLYFNHAAIAPWPASTAEAIRQFASENESLGPAQYARWIALEKSLRQRLATLIGARSSNDIALLKNTTEGISTVAWGLDWSEGDNIVLPKDEFPSNRLPWLAQAERGVEIREIDIRLAPHAETALIEAMDKNTRILALSSVQWSDGFRLDLYALGQACHKRGILFFVDAIQQLGALQLDVEACHISFLAADAHKWLLGPEGIAVFYTSEQARSEIQLRQLGWHMFENPWAFGREDWTPASSACRFEAGSPNTLGQFGFEASLNVLLGSDMAKVEQSVLENTSQLLTQLKQLAGIQLITRSEPGRRSGIVTFKPSQLSAQAVQRALAGRNVTCAVRDNAIRLSPHFYQGSKEIEQVFEVIEQVLSTAT